MRLLVFGGSFDPPHRGHIALLSAAAEKIRPDKILVVPAYQAPLKGAPRASSHERLRLLRAGFLPFLPARWRRITRIDAGELNSRRRIYAVDTLRRLSRLYPGAELHFAAGSDSAASFGRWKNPRALKSLCSWWAGPRPGSKGKIPSHFKRLPGRFPDISSTEIRARLAAGRGTAAFLTPPVAAAIEKRGLYGAGILSALRRSLSPERFEHTLAVADLAESLARRWGLDAGKAQQAALLHDCGRSVPVPLMAAYARERRLPVPAFDDVARHHPLLIHAYISADLARRRFGVSDPEVLNAIRRHTLGDRRMTALDRLLYVADAASADRDYPAAASIRALAYRDLEAALRACVLNKIQHALTARAWLHPLTISLWNSLQTT